MTADSDERDRLAPVLRLVARASSLHVGGIATMAWLRQGLVETRRVTIEQFDRAFAVARLTPGTNLLAFYSAVGFYVARWRGTLACLTVATVLPSAIIVVLSSLYVQHAGNPLLDRFMNGARAGAVAILGWTAARLFVAAADTRRVRAFSLAAVTLGTVTIGRLPLILILLGAAAAGSVLFRSEP